MNHPQHLLPKLRIERRQFKHVVRAVLHTICFGRLLDRQDYSEFEVSGLGVRCCRVDDVQLERHIEEQLDLLENHVRQSRDHLFTVTLAFFIESTEKGILSTRKVRHNWESWTLPVQVVHHQPMTRDELVGVLDHVQLVCMEHTSHIPSEVLDGASPFRCVVTFDRKRKKSGDGWLGSAARFFASDAPPLG
ncbi:MAG: hypothetical protein MHM6MM_002729 [Cercozoa sp. M6MM]